jgi:hypothetical protein
MATTVRRGDRAPNSKPVQEVKYNGSTALYGRSGTGKTTLSASWPKPILYLNIKDNGTDSISDVEDIDVVHIDSIPRTCRNRSCGVTSRLRRVSFPIRPSY